MASKRKAYCLLHRRSDKSSKGDLVDITDSSWEKITVCASIHKDRPKSTWLEVANAIPDGRPSDGKYHLTCFRSFTAVPKTGIDAKLEIRKKSDNQTKSNASLNPSPSTSSSDPTPSSSCQISDQNLSTIPTRSSSEAIAKSSTGVHPRICMMCKAEYKKLKGGSRQKVTQIMTTGVESELKSMIRNDEQLWLEYGNINLKAKEVCYHVKCKSDYKPNTASPQIDTVFNQFYAEMKDQVFVRLKLINTETSYDAFKQIFNRTFTNRQPERPEPPTKQWVIQKLLTHFDTSIKSYRTKPYNVLYKATIKETDIPIMLRKMEVAKERTILLTKAAKEIKSICQELKRSCDPLPTVLTSKHFREGQAPLPDELMDFSKELVCIDPKNPTEKEIRQAKSLVSDIVYFLTKGSVKPAKQISMGVGMKSMTNSTLVIRTLHRFGQCISPTEEQGIITEIAEAVTSCNIILPDGLYAEAGLATSICFDNYDELCDSIYAGKQATHDTTGNVYQNRKAIGAAPPPERVTQAPMAAQDPQPAKRRRTSYTGINDTEIPPYNKTPKVTRFSYRSYTAAEPVSLAIARHRDLLWIFECSTSASVPMWRGWNASTVKDPLPIQNIGYVKNICQSPTQLNVVKLTMDKAEKLRQEVGEDYMLDGYDLAIAKPAWRIQDTETPRYDRLFIETGPFHFEMPFFAGVGYFITFSGLDELMVQCEILGPGSLAGFLEGRHYNRCVRNHPINFIVLSLLQLEQCLLKNYNSSSLPDDVVAELKALEDEPSEEAVLALLEKPDSPTMRMMTTYSEYCRQASDGEHGLTPQFYNGYMDMISHWFVFARGVRTNDVDLYTYGAQLMIPVMWSANRTNYKRWSIKSVLQFINREISHPGITNYLNKGALSVRRTPRPFSRTAHDITLEQSNNKDSASKLTGVKSYTCNVSGRQRWSESRSQRAQAVSILKEMAGISDKEQSSQECKKARITKDRNDVKTLLDAVKNSLNPFDPTLDKTKLFRITGGHAVSEEIAAEVIDFYKTGKAWCEEFINECKNDPARFEKPIKSKKVRNLAADGLKVKMKTKDLKLITVTFTRDMFGTLLMASNEQNISLKHVLSFPITPAPLSMAQINGSMNQARNKASLMHRLEKLAIPVEDVRVDTVIIDFMFFLRSNIKQLPSKYGDIAKKLIQIAKKNYAATQIVIVCDVYSAEGPSVKDVCRSDRGVTDESCHFPKIGYLQKRPNDLEAALKSKKFIVTLLEFLADEWQTKRCEDLLRDVALHYSFGPCYSYQVVDDSIQRTQIRSLQTEGHEEADTAIIFYGRMFSRPGKNMCVRCDDTDVGVLLANHQKGMSGSVYLDMGLNSKNNRRMWDMKQLGGTLSPAVCEALLGYHPFSGGDYTACFNRKGKVIPYDKMLHDEESLKALSKLGTSEIVTQELVDALQRYVCLLYSTKKNSQDTVLVNEKRALILESKLPKKNKLQKLRSFDPVSLPPCLDVLMQKIKRSNFIAHRYRNAHKRVLPSWDPTENGWKVQEGRLVPQWFTGERVPEDLYYDPDAESDEDESDDEEEEEEEENSDDSSDEDSDTD